MGLLVPVAAAIGSAVLGAGGAAAAGAGITAAVGGTIAATTLLGVASTAKTLLSGAPKPPAAPTAPPVPPPPGLPAPPQAPVGSSATNRSLAAMSPGLALGGTGTILGSAPSGNQKTLLGQ